MNVPKFLSNVDPTLIRYWTGEKWKVGWRGAKVTKGKNKGAWYVYVREFRAEKGGKPSLRWVKRIAKERSIRELEPKEETTDTS